VRDRCCYLAIFFCKRIEANNLGSRFRAGLLPEDKTTLLISEAAKDFAEYQPDRGGEAGLKLDALKGRPGQTKRASEINSS